MTRALRKRALRLWAAGPRRKNDAWGTRLGSFLPSLGRLNATKSTREKEPTPSSNQPAAGNSGPAGFRLPFHTLIIFSRQIQSITLATGAGRAYTHVLSQSGNPACSDEPVILWGAFPQNLEANQW